MAKLTTDQIDKIDKKRKRLKRIGLKKLKRLKPALGSEYVIAGQLQQRPSPEEERRLALKTKVMGNKKPTSASKIGFYDFTNHALHPGRRGLYGNPDQYSKEWMEIFKKEFFRWTKPLIKGLFWVSVVVLSVLMILEWLGVVA